MNEPEETNELEDQQSAGKDEKYQTVPIKGMYENWFLDYASYVILERAVPEIDDGLKPVQRRILHAMYRLDDGRFNKVANIIGHTMQFHPHGDASIGDALVQLGQKEILVDTQGNWGNVLTGDRSAAPRYIESRLSGFAKEVVFNPKTTEWKSSYDGRNKEPMTLPVKFPLLLAQGVEGIAVGLASKILPHNFLELIDASIKYLQGKSFDIVPDFPTGGMADFARYNEGLRGGKVRVRAKISQLDKRTLVINEIPFTTTTTSLIDSIVSANDKGKIKIKKIDDNTAENVEIVIQLATNVSPDQTMDALYAFTNCEVSVSPNSCVIFNEKPAFLSVKYILKHNTDHTVHLLKTELEIRLSELESQWHNSSLEKIFIENRIYLDIENCETWDSVLETIDKGLKPFKKNLKRKIIREDIVRLTEIKIKRISKYNAFKAVEQIQSIEDEIEEVKNHLANLIDYSINYYRQIKKKYGKGRQRKTEIRNFDTISATLAAVANQKLYINRKEGFAGTSLRKDEYVGECSDIDDIVVFRDDGTLTIMKIAPKVFIGKNVIHMEVFKKNDDRTIYNLIYRDGRRGKYYVKRFPVKGITRDKGYNITAGTEGSKVIYFTANPNGEAEVIKVNLRPKPRMKKTSFDFDFSQLAIKGRSARGNILSRFTIKNILQREQGVSTLGARGIWYDDTVRRLNTEERGEYLGAFKGDDKLLIILSSGEFRLTSYDLNTYFDDEMIHLSKYDPEKIITAVYVDGEREKYYAKRFQISIHTVIDKKYMFIPESKGSKMILYSMDYLPRVELEVNPKKGNEIEFEVVPLADFIGIKSYRAKGKRLSNKDVKKITLMDPLPYDSPEKEELPAEEDRLENAEVEEPQSIAEPENAEDKQEEKEIPEAKKKSEKKKKPELKEKQKLKENPDETKGDGPETQMELEF